LPAKQGLIRDFIDVVLEALAASTPTIRSLLLRRLAYLADGQQLAEDPLGKKARGQLLAPSVTAWTHTAFPELRADRPYHQPDDDSRLDP
jgi:hypothetical protein